MVPTGDLVKESRVNHAVRTGIATSMPKSSV
jgi:hypothetical protein